MGWKTLVLAMVSKGVKSETFNFWLPFMAHKHPCLSSLLCKEGGGSKKGVATSVRAYDWNNGLLHSFFMFRQVQSGQTGHPVCASLHNRSKTFGYKANWHQAFVTRGEGL